VYETTPKEAISASDQTHAANIEHPAASTSCVPHNVGHHHHHHGPDHPFHPPPCHKHKGKDGLVDDDGDTVLFDRRQARRERVILLENRIASLEGMLARQTDVPRTALLRQKGDTRTNETFFRGKGFRTQYYGPSNSSGLFPRVRHTCFYSKFFPPG